MEYDILNELISDTVDRFFYNRSYPYPFEGSKNIFQPSTPLSSVVSKKTPNSQQQQTYQNTSNQQVQQSTSTSTALQKPNTTSSLGTSSSLRSSVQSASTSVQLSSPNANIQQSSTNTNISINGNVDNTKKSGFVAQKNNLFDMSQQTMTPELWLQKEGPNKLKEAQIRLNLNLQRVSRSDLEQMSIDQLMQEKKRVKNELKMYDASFQSHFNRFPAKNEKEPLRPLYIYYKKLKQFMTNKNNGVPIADSNDLNERDTLDSTRPSNSANTTNATSMQSLNTSRNAPPNQTELLRKIEEIKKVRADLREKLHNYQTEFFKNHNRRIRYHKDIQQVEKEYKEYKDTKQELLRLENLLQR